MNNLITDEAYNHLIIRLQEDSDSDDFTTTWQKLITYEPFICHKKALEDSCFNYYIAFFIFHLARKCPQQFEDTFLTILSKNNTESGIAIFTTVCALYFKHYKMIDYSLDNNLISNWTLGDISLGSIAISTNDNIIIKKALPKILQTKSIKPKITAFKFLYIFRTINSKDFSIQTAILNLDKTKFIYIKKLIPIDQYFLTHHMPEVYNTYRNFFYRLINLIDEQNITANMMALLGCENSARAKKIFLKTLNIKKTDTSFKDSLVLSVLSNQKTKPWAIKTIAPLIFDHITSKKQFTWSLTPINSKVILNLISLTKPAQQLKAKLVEVALVSHSIKGRKLNSKEFNLLVDMATQLNINILEIFSIRPITGAKQGANDIFLKNLFLGNLRVCDFVLKYTFRLSHKKAFETAFSSSHKHAVDYLISRGFKIGDMAVNSITYFESLLRPWRGFYQKGKNNYKFKKYLAQHYYKHILPNIKTSKIMRQGGGALTNNNQIYQNISEIIFGLGTEIIPNKLINKVSLWHHNSWLLNMTSIKEPHKEYLFWSYGDFPVLCSWMASVYLIKHGWQALSHLIFIYCKYNSLATIKMACDYLIVHKNKIPSNYQHKIIKDLLFAIAARQNTWLLQYVIDNNIVNESDMRSIRQNDTIVSVALNYEENLVDRMMDYDDDDVQFFHETSIKFLSFLESNNININLTNKKKENLLFSLVKSTDVNQLTQEIVANFNVNILQKNTSHKTIIDIANEFGNFEIGAYIEKRIFSDTLNINSTTKKNKI